MNYFLRILFSFLTLIFLFSGCQKLEETPNTSEQPNTIQSIPKDIAEKIAAAGYSPNGAQKFRDGYLIEGDIYLTEADLNAIKGTTSSNKKTSIPGVKHYRMFLEVAYSVTRNISVYIDPAFDSNIEDGLNIAIERYNQMKIGLTFTRLSSPSGAEITIGAFYDNLTDVGGYTYNPQTGDPWSSIDLNTFYNNNSLMSSSEAASVIAHEMGHAIGFRHTDYFNRCGSNTNEGQGTYGAYHIPGTPTGVSADSWMNACGFQNRPFTFHDAIALTQFYPFAYPDGSLIRETSSTTVYVIYGGAKFALSSPAEVVAYGGWGNVQVVADGALYITGATGGLSFSPRNFTLLRENSDTAVYLIIDGEKRWLTSSTVVDRYGWDLVRVVPDGSLSYLSTGAPIY